MPYIPLFCLIAGVRTSSTTMNRSSEFRHICLVSDPRQKAFSLSPLSMMLVVDFISSVLRVFKKFLFNWRLITLQYCGGFYHTLTWISYGCTCVPHPEPPPTSSPSHPFGLSQYTGFECPVSCIELGLVISFT